MVDFEAEVFAESGAVGGIGWVAATEPAARSRRAYRIVICSLLAVEAAWLSVIAAVVWWVLR